MFLEMQKKIPWLVTATSLCLPWAALAQPKPADPAVSAPGLKYQSAFSDYKPWQETPASDWKAVNETVKGGSTAQGHASHGTSAPASPAASAPKPGPGMHGHGHQHMHGGHK